MRKICLVTLLFIPLLAKEAVYKNLDLNRAIAILKSENLEINIARFDEKIKRFEHKIAKSYNYGKLDFIQNALRSNDAGNVFGFKLQSREATFGDFGFSDFLTPPAGTTNILDVEPRDLNYPKARNHFQTKLHYEVPLYTGGKLEQYSKITQALEKLSKLDTKKILSQKIFELKKSYYDIYLLDSYLKNLKIIEKNMNRLEDMARSMIEEGYAKKIDLLEVQSKKANVVRMIKKAQANKELVYHFLSFLLNAKVESIVGNYQRVNPEFLDTKKILEKNIDIRKAKEGLRISKMAIELQKASSRPQIGAFLEYGSSDNTPFNEFFEKDSYTAGVQFKWTLFDGGASRMSVQKARVENLKVQSQLSLAQRGIKLQVEKIKTEIKSFDFDIDSLQKEIELTRAIYKNYLGRYQEKLVSINDVIIKQSLEIEKVLKLKEIQNSRVTKILELEKIANGEIL